MNVERICEVIDKGGIVITPTDTVYGIMGDALDEDVVKKIFEVKQRPYNKPLIVLMDSFEMVKDYTEKLSEKERKVMEKFWPGLVTFIVKKNDKISNLITGGNDTVGIRIPDNKELLQIIRQLGRPVVSTSANITGTEVITGIEILENDLIEKIDYIEDGGVLNNQSSTIIKIDDDKLYVLREGILTSEICNYFEVNL